MPLVVCFRSPLATDTDRLVQVVLPICSSWIGKSMKWSRGRFTPLMPVRSKGAQDPPSFTIGSVAGPGNSGAFTTGRVTCSCPMSGSLLTVSSLLESSFESYTLRPLNVRPWPRSYPLLNLPAFPHALCRLYKHLIQFHSCSKVLLYSMRFLNLVMLLLFGSRLNKIQSWLFIKASRCNER